MTPSSYANAAGLQSEINHVTITRVAFSEVQYRRSVNSYRRDMRFTINAISREQKRLRRSMRDYSRVLRKGRLDRESRKQAEWEDSKKDNSSSTDNPVISSSDVTQSIESVPVHDVIPHSITLPDVVSEATEEKLMKSNSTFVSSESHDREKEHRYSATKKDDKASSKTTKKRKPLIGKKTSRNKAYFKSKRHLSRTSSTTASEPEKKEEPTEAKDENEGNTEETDASSAKPEDKDAVRDKTKDMTNKGVSLDALRLRLGSHAQEHGDSNASAENKWQQLHEKHESDELVPKDRPRRRRKIKSEVTLGDLIKLQHTRGSKKLFQLVDKLAKRHGVLEEAPAGHSPVPDTRDTARLVNKSDHFVNSTAFRTAGAFYPIKYGYAVSEEMGKFVFLPSVEVVQESEEDDFDLAEQQREYPKPVYGNLESPAGDSDFWDKVQKDLSTRRLEVSLLETPGQTERRSKRILSLPSLVKAVTRFKEGASGAHSLRPKSEVLPDTQTDITFAPSSRGGGLSSRTSGKNSSDRTLRMPRKLPPLQKKGPHMEKPDESSKVGWTTALQSMKLVHTLTDLKHHF